MLVNQGEDKKKKKIMLLSLTLFSASLSTDTQCHLFQPYKP